MQVRINVQQAKITKQGQALYSSNTGCQAASPEMKLGTDGCTVKVFKRNSLFYRVDRYPPPRTMASVVSDGEML